MTLCHLEGCAVDCFFVCNMYEYSYKDVHSITRELVFLFSLFSLSCASRLTMIAE